MVSSPISPIPEIFSLFSSISLNTDSASSCASPTRAACGGGEGPSGTDVIDYVQIMTTGNAIDFGNLNVGGQYPAALSNGHGGL